MAHLLRILQGGVNSQATDPPNCGAEGNPDPPDRVEVTVHEAAQQPGYIVKLAQFEDGEQVRLSRWFVGSEDGGLAEAEAMARSIMAYIEIGLPVAALFGEEGDGR